MSEFDPINTGRLVEESFLRREQGGEPASEITENWKTAARIRAERKALGITREKLAQKYGLDPSQLLDFEHGLITIDPESALAQVYRELGIDIGILGFSTASPEDLGL